MEALAQLKASKEKVQSLRGTITSGETLLNALTVRDEVMQLLDRIIVYSHMRKDEDNSNTKYQGYADQAAAAAVELGSAGAFLEPEI